MCHVHVPIACNEYNHYVMQTFSNKNFLERKKRGKKIFEEVIAKNLSKIWWKTLIHRSEEKLAKT